MLTWIATLTVVAIASVVYFAEADPMAVHTDSNPPNSALMVESGTTTAPVPDQWNYTLVLPAPAPSHRAEYVEPTPTPTLTPVPTPTSAPVAAQALTEAPPRLPVGDIQAMICAYDWPCHEALFVADCESNFDPLAYGFASTEKAQFLGIFQLWNGHFSAGQDWRDAATNIAVAFGVWSGSGWGPWDDRCEPR